MSNETVTPSPPDPKPRQEVDKAAAKASAAPPKKPFVKVAVPLNMTVIEAARAAEDVVDELKRNSNKSAEQIIQEVVEKRKQQEKE